MENQRRTNSTPFTGRSKSRLGQQSDASDRPELAIKMDYSSTYRENEELDGVLEVQLDDLHKNQYRMWNEKGEQLKQIRRQVEVIVRLRQAVNSRKPGDSIDIVSSARPRRVSRQRSSTRKTDETYVDPIDVEEIAKATRSQMRISQEREKFSSKNLFNVFRKSNGGLGSDYTSVGINSNGTTNNSNRLFTQCRPVATMAMMNESSNGGIERSGDSNRVSMRQRPETAQALKGFQRETRSSLHGNRPKTAAARSRPSAANGNDPLPPRVPSARRSRSRRQLEILCRAHSEVDEPSVEVEDVPEWEIVRETQRRQKLQQLRSQREFLDLRVNRFLCDLEQFNNPKQPQSGLCFYDDE